MLTEFELRDFQKEALRALRRPGHLLCVAPTGSGKSLIFEKLVQRPGVRMLLVTPLVALGRQQARKLRAQGIEVSLASGNSLGEEFAVLPSEKTQAWIVSPETLQFQSRKKILDEWRPSLLVVDECHCLWEWGEDFRPAFADLPELIEEFQIARSLWLTATLPFEARKRLRARLPGRRVEIGSFEIPEQLSLSFHQVPWVNRSAFLAELILNQAQGPGLIFVSTRESTLKVTRLLSAMGKRAVSYHAGMSQEERRILEDQVRSGVPEIVVATSAFGMGMDFSHLRWVLLWQLPHSVLSLAQAMGRVGRSHQKGQAWVLWDYEDFRLLEWGVRSSPRRLAELKALLSLMKDAGCRKAAITRYFEGITGSACGSACERCREKSPSIKIV